MAYEKLVVYTNIDSLKSDTFLCYFLWNCNKEQPVESPNSFSCIYRSIYFLDLLKWREVPGYCTLAGDLYEHYATDPAECTWICEEQYPDRCLSVDYRIRDGLCVINDPSSPIEPS